VGLKIIKDLRTQFSLLIKRWLSPVYVASWISLAFCGVLFVTLGGLFRVTELQDTQTTEKQEMDDAIHLVLNLEIEFKSQIESWKNFLLRGSDPDMFNQYRRGFEKSESSIQLGLTELISSGHFIEYPTDELRKLVMEHRQVGKQFRSIVDTLDPANASSFLLADKAAYDLGKLTAEGFVRVDEVMHLHALSMASGFEEEMKAVARQVTMFSMLSVAFGIVLSAAFIVDRSRKEKGLWSAKTVAENANRAKDSFLANISHEIRTPMNAIVGLSEVLSDTTLTSDQEEYVNTIRNSGSDLLGIINEILDLSKMEAGKFEIRAESFQLQACVEDAADVIEPKAIHKGVAFSFELDPGLPLYITADEMRVRQIMINLLGNAVKFTEKGRIELKLDGAYDKAGDYVLSIHVSDTGGGIRDEDLEKLFQAFSQVDDSNANPMVEQYMKNYLAA
jgi:signal transduction histidine kinase